MNMFGHLKKAAQTVVNIDEFDATLQRRSQSFQKQANQLKYFQPQIDQTLYGESEDEDELEEPFQQVRRLCTYANNGLDMTSND